MTEGFSTKKIETKDRDYSDFEKFKKNKNKPQKRLKIGRYFLLVLLIGFVYSLIIYVFPKVEVTIFLTSEEASQDYEIVIEEGIDKSLGDVLYFPGEVRTLSTRHEGEFEATGEKNIGDKATGKATFYNFTGRTSPITSKIELDHPSGKKYFLKENIVVPQAKVSDDGEILPGQIEVEIEAPEGGEDYNNSGARINISILPEDMKEKIYAEVGEIAGGTSEVVQVVSQEDLDNAKDSLLDEITPKMKDELREKIGKTSFSFRDELLIVEIDELEKEVELGQKVENFKVEIKARLKALVFDENDIKTYLRDQVERTIPTKTMLAEGDLGRLEMEIKNFDFENERAEIVARSFFDVYPEIDLNELKEKIKGKEEKEARRLLMQENDIRDVRFDFSRNLANRVPSNLGKIEFILGDNE
jgi:hypothetical protein